MRCLLKKSVKKDALITIILNNLDNPHDYKDRFINKGYSEKESALLVKKMRLPEERYKSFFGEDRMEISYKGFEEYLNKNGGSVNG